MDRNQLFLETIADIEKRTRPASTEYERTMVAALLRKLLLDGDPLCHQVNKVRREEIKFIVNHHPL
jgi:hypothetical protein